MSLVKDQPRHPYELMQELGDKNGGSAKSLFPVLQTLCDEGLLSVDVDFGWRTYWLTEAGKAELQAKETEVKKVSTVDDGVGPSIFESRFLTQLPHPSRTFCGRVSSIDIRR